MVPPSPPPTPTPPSSSNSSYVQSNLVEYKGLFYINPLKDPADRDKFEVNAIKRNPMDILNTLASINAIAERLNRQSESGAGSNWFMIVLLAIGIILIVGGMLGIVDFARKYKRTRIIV